MHPRTPYSRIVGRGGNQDGAPAAAPTRAKEPANGAVALHGMDLTEVFSKLEAADPNEPDWRTPNDFYVAEANQFSRWTRSDYLESLPGVGEKLAEAIVDELGTDCLERIDADPEVLRGVAERPGVSTPAIEALIADWEKHRADRKPVEIDEAVAHRLLKLDYEGDFQAYRRWFVGSRNLVPSPDQTCPGMSEAGAELAASIKAGEKIAVFCDYDVDGTTAGEVFRRGLSPYEADLHYGYADAQSGFGLTEEFVREAADSGAKVLVTLDCGSGQGDMVALAQKLGMKVIVVDHHHVEENPADHHLNPQLYNPPSSANTGAQLAWKLAAAVQVAADGHTREDHWEEPMHLAGMGCLADMGSVVLPENRAFFWSSHNHPAPGVRALAEALEEDPTTPGGWIMTQACLNLPKRTSKVSAADVGALFAAADAAEAKPIVKKLVASYERAREVREEMTTEALAQTGQAVWGEDGTISRPDPKKFISSVIFRDHAEYAGYTGPVASKISRSTAKPAVVFAYRGEDEHGQQVYKFSSRNDSGVRHALGELIDDPAMKAACTLKRRNEMGDVVEAPTVGGHREVVSGACTAENLDKVLEAMEGWAEKKGGKDGSRFWPLPWDGPDAYLSERKVAGERLEAIEKQATRLGPFSRRRDLAAPLRKGREPKLASNPELQISTVGTLRKLEVDPDNDRWLIGELELDNGATREVRYPADAPDRPEDETCEWILKVGKPGPYYLRKFARTVRPGD